MGLEVVIIMSLFDTYVQYMVAVVSDLVTMTIGMYKLVTVVEIYSGFRIRSSIDPTGCNDKTKCRQMCKFSDDIFKISI